MNALTLASLVMAALAAGIHVVIFRMESLTWSRPATWRRFGVGSQEDAETVRPMAFNQGFYNLFLALGAIVGIALVVAGGVDASGTSVASVAGTTLLIVSLGSMLLAATVLIASKPSLAQAAGTQGFAPLLSLVLLLGSIAA